MRKLGVVGMLMRNFNKDHLRKQTCSMMHQNASHGKMEDSKIGNSRWTNRVCDLYIDPNDLTQNIGLDIY